jgi:hypothetical protein
MPRSSPEGLGRAKINLRADNLNQIQGLELAQSKRKIHRQREEIAKLKRSISTLRDKLKGD